MSGHNKWSSIKHRKGAQDAKRGKLFTKLIKEVTIAARMGGGDISGNPRLRRAVDEAKANNMPLDKLQRAIKKGTGELEGVDYEELQYEGVGPNGTLWIVQVVTDNRNRSAADIRKIFDKNGGQLGTSGSAAWAFDEKGLLILSAHAATEEQLFELAVGAGAEDLARDEDQWIITTPRDKLDEIREVLSNKGLEPQSASLQMIAKTPKIISGQDAETAINLAEALEDNDDVQSVASDFEIEDDAQSDAAGEELS